MEPGVFIQMPIPSVPRFRNPYDSPRVMRAVIDDMVEQVEQKFYGLLLQPDTLAVMRTLINDLCDCVYFRGVKLGKLIAIDVETHPQDSTSILISFRGLNEDGRWLLSKMKVDEPEQPPEPITEKVTPKLKTTRVVEI